MTSNWTHDQIARYLTYTGWDNATYAWDVSPGDSITFSVSGLTYAGKTLARTALSAWEAVSGISFRETGAGAEIVFDDNEPGAVARFNVMGGHIVNASVNVGTAWLSTHGTALNSYSLQTYLHEIGHVLGLAHAGDYHGDPRFGRDNLYLNDSWQQTVMSYFDQNENTSVNASFAHAITPQMVDIIAVQKLYGAAGDIRTGNTVYGTNSTAGGHLDQIARLGNATFTILDDGGIDTLNTSSYSGWQKVDLTPESHSSVFGETGNLAIARGTVLENFVGGRGNEFVTGNHAANRIILNGGNDTAHGRGGNDILNGGAGNDSLFGNAGNDTLYGGAGNDVLKAGAGNDRLYGGLGDDRLIGADLGVDVMYGAAGRDVLSGFGGADQLHGGGDGDWLHGGAGNDRLFGDAGNDVLRGNNGNDALNGGPGTDRLYGGGDNDWLYGGPGRDFLLGEAGADILVGQGGNDDLTGGAGADRFIFRDLGHGRDRILDFQPGLDRIDLTDFAFRGMAELRTVANDTAAGVRLEFDAANSLEVQGFAFGELERGDFLL